MKRWKLALYVFTSGCVCALGWHCGLIPSLHVPSFPAILAGFGL